MTSVGTIDGQPIVPVNARDDKSAGTNRGYCGVGVGCGRVFARSRGSSFGPYSVSIWSRTPVRADMIRRFTPEAAGLSTFASTTTSIL